MSDKPAADVALRGALERSLHAAGSRPLSEVLTEVAAAVRETSDSPWAAIVLWAADGRPELEVIAGDQDAARAEITGPFTAADPPPGIDTGVQRTPSGRDSAITLTAPVVLRGRAAGTIQVMAPRNDADLTETELIVQAVATGVGAIIERSRTVAANARRERWLSGGTEIVRALTSAPHPDPLTMIAERAAEIAGADSVVLLSPLATPGSFRVEAVAGDTATTARQQVADTADGHIGQVFTDGRALRADLASTSDLLVGATLFAPMHGSAGLRGVMGFGRAAGGAFTEAELGMATMFAGTVALALELAESQSHREQTALILERDRIARDLHDHVIQRLYAIGLTMQHVSSLVSTEAADRLVTAVTDIDAAIAQIRSTIFRLTTPILGADLSLRARAEALVDELEPVLGYRPSLTSEGPLDFGLDDELVTDCEAVLREGLTNIARHAQATRADVKIIVGRDRMQIEIYDDGRGLGDTDRRSGLGNLRQRAEQHGGTLAIIDTGHTGTQLIWTVPLGD